MKRVPAPYTRASSGKDMYLAYCASCHGKDGKGNGPAASALKSVPNRLDPACGKQRRQVPGEPRITDDQRRLQHSESRLQGHASLGFDLCVDGNDERWFDAIAYSQSDEVHRITATVGPWQVLCGLKTGLFKDILDSYPVSQPTFLGLPQAACKALEETHQAMSRPTLEVADIIRAASNSFGMSMDRTIHGSIARCSMPSSAAALRLWEFIAINAFAAAIRPSRITHVATGTAPSARGTHAPSDWPRVRLNCYPCLTSTLSLPCP